MLFFNCRANDTTFGWSLLLGITRTYGPRTKLFYAQEFEEFVLFDDGQPCKGRTHNDLSENYSILV